MLNSIVQVLKFKLSSIASSTRFNLSYFPSRLSLFFKGFRGDITNHIWFILLLEIIWFAIIKWPVCIGLNEPKIKAALFEEYSLNENKDIMIVSKETPAMEIHSGVYNNSIIPIGTLLTTKYFISLQLIGLIIVSCVVGSIAITKNTIENDDEMEELLWL